MGTVGTVDPETIRIRYLATRLTGFSVFGLGLLFCLQCGLLALRGTTHRFGLAYVGLVGLACIGSALAARLARTRPARAITWLAYLALVTVCAMVALDWVVFPTGFPTIVLLLVPLIVVMFSVRPRPPAAFYGLLVAGVFVATAVLYQSAEGGLGAIGVGAFLRYRWNG